MFERELLQQLHNAGLARWAKQLEEQLPRRFSTENHGDYVKWAEAVEQLPTVKPSIIDLNRDTIRVGAAKDIDGPNRQQLTSLLKQLHPWRKGPFELFGIQIDTEWRADWKWQRLAEHIQPLEGRSVLDVGAGNGYYAWRMRGAGAAWVIGIDPTLVYAMQFQALQHYVRDPQVHALPLGIEDTPTDQQAFDTVFSMGVFYHRRSPLDHLLELKGQLRPGGELVLETLVVDGDAQTALVPRDRYAQMRNVWFIPSCEALVAWLERCGYADIKLVDVTTTTAEEQRPTEWMNFKSLADFLDPDNPQLTVEGYPAPRRAIVVARR